MSVERTIFQTLKDVGASTQYAVESRVYRDLAPPDVVDLPRVIFQQVGGRAVNFIDGGKPSKKNARFQISSWHRRRDEAMALARLVEDAMRAETDLGTTVIGAAIAIYDEDARLYGAIQDFSVWYDD